MAGWIWPVRLVSFLNTKFSRNGRSPMAAGIWLERFAWKRSNVTIRFVFGSHPTPYQSSQQSVLGSHELNRAGFRTCLICKRIFFSFGLHLSERQKIGRDKKIKRIQRMWKFMLFLYTGMFEPYGSLCRGGNFDF